MKAKAMFWRVCFSWRDTTVRQGAKKSCKVHFYISFKRSMLTETCIKTDLYTTETTTMVTIKNNQGQRLLAATIEQLGTSPDKAWRS